MLKKIGVKNFKAFKEKTIIELETLNIISGVNSSGKSSMYQSLFLILQSLEAEINYGDSKINFLRNGKYFDYGPALNIQHDLNNAEIEFYFEWEDNKRLTNIYSLMEIKTKTKRSEEETKKIFILKESKYEEDDKYYHVKRNENEKWDVEAENILMFQAPMIDKIIQECLLEGVNLKELGLKTKYNELVKFENVDIKTKNHMLDNFIIKDNDILACLNEEVQKIFRLDFFKEKITEELRDFGEENLILIASINRHVFDDLVEYIPPFRGLPKRIYLEETPLDGYELNIYKNVYYDYDFNQKKIKRASLEEALKYWLVDKLKIVDEIFIKEDYDLEIKQIIVKNNEKQLPLPCVGFGVSQIVPVIYKVLSSEKDIIIIDEPEIHLHPKIQSELAEFFYKISKTKKKLIIETHSEYILQKIIYLKLKYKLENDLKMYWIEKENNNSKLKEIEYDDLGYVLNAPEDFLSERDKLLKELSKLRLELI